MRTRTFFFALVVLFAVVIPPASIEAASPNIVFIFIDDMGYGDIGPFGNTVNQTPNLDRMAAEGNVLRQFYVSNTACTPSRSALMTGTYAHRIGMDGTVVFPGEKRGLNPDEVTIAELLKSKGYATGCFGKWHLGDQPQFMPLTQGFDDYFGIPYSNDMWPGNKKGHRHTKEPYTPLPVIRQNEAVAYVSDGADQSLLCEVVTDEAVKFINKHRHEPFFLYLPHAYVHGPRYARKGILEKAGGDVNRANVEEVDTSVGRVLDTLRELEIADNTLVIFTSDNGGAGGMSMGPLRGGKGGAKYEGHMREPTISWWPGTIPAGKVTDEIVATIDILPSLARLVDAEVPDDRIIDGRDALDVLLGKPDAKSPHPVLYYENTGIRRGKWKLVLGTRRKFELYDLDADLGETNDISAQHPEVVDQLKALLQSHTQEIESNQRSAGFVDEAKPIISSPGDLPRLREFMGLNDLQLGQTTARPPIRSRNRTATTRSAKDAPNVLFIAIDDMNDWSTLFDPKNPIQTPNLKRLADRGCFFSHAYCASPGCNPSRTAIMTGLRPTSSGVYANGNPWRKILPGAVTLPQYFAEQGGYATRGAGKIFHHGRTGAEDPNNPSFQEFFQKLAIRAPEKNYNGYSVDDESHLGKTAFDWGQHDQKMIDVDMAEWVEQRMEETWEQPLFLAAGIFNPHLPFYAPAENFTRYPLEKTVMPPMPSNDLDDVGDIAKGMAHKEYWVYDNTILKQPGSPGSLQRMVQCYQAASDFADEMVGRLLDKLDASGRAENTIIVLWADHGYHLGDKESCVKFTLWEKANRVPFIVVAPGVTTPGTRCDRPVGLIDIYPTLLELAGLPAKADNDGQSLVPLLRDPDAQWEHPALMTEGRGNHAVRSDRWRYIHYSDGAEELYDHEVDPWEWNNLAADPQYAEVIATHKKWLPKQEAQVGVATDRSIAKTSDSAAHERVLQAQASGGKVARVDITPAPYAPTEGDILITDFEGGDYGDWESTGEAFGERPSVAGISPRNRVTGYLGKGLVNTFLDGDKSVGVLTSPPFTIERPRLNFLIGGGNHPGKTCINLLVDGVSVRTAIGPALKDTKGREVMDWNSWKVAKFVGKQARLEIVDAYSKGWGHINIDHIFQSDVGMVPSMPTASTAPTPAPRVRFAERSGDMTFDQLDTLRQKYAAQPDAYQEDYRPQFHFTPQTGWMNDPNGLVFHNGQYHLYFQAWPQNVRAGGKIWSHAVSTDLVHWKQIEHALLNEGRRQIFSGSAVIDHNNTAGFQQGDVKTLIAAYTLTSPNVQCIAYSNDRGRTFTKVETPVVDTILDKDRDPKVFWHQASGQWVMMLYLGAPEKFVLLGSKNLKDWTKLSDVHFPAGHECPEFFELPIDGDENNTRWVAWEAAGNYMIGQFDGKQFTPDSPTPLPSEWGNNCYAGQTWNDVPDGRRIFIGWMRAKLGRHVTEEIYPDMPFTQQMSVPRSLSLRSTEAGLRLFAMPVKELESLRKPGHQWKEIDLEPGANPFSKLSGELFDIEADIELGNSSRLTLDIRGTPLVYDTQARTLSCQEKSVEAPPIDGRLRLRVLVDRTSIEVFANDGRYVMSFCFRPDAANKHLSLAVSGGAATARSLSVWPLKSIWPVVTDLEK